MVDDILKKEVLEINQRYTQIYLKGEKKTNIYFRTVWSMDGQSVAAELTLNNYRFRKKSIKIEH